MKIAFLLPTGVIEWPIPPELQEQFNFVNTANTFRINGYFIAHDIHIRYDQIVGMVLQREDQVSPVLKGTLQ